MKNPKLISVAYGFYYFGNLENAPEGYIKLTSAAMSVGFSGGKGIPGVCRGDDSAKIILDRFCEDSELLFPIQNVLGIHTCIDLYKFKGTTIR